MLWEDGLPSHGAYRGVWAFKRGRLSAGSFNLTIFGRPLPRSLGSIVVVARVMSAPRGQRLVLDFLVIQL